jgi:hypothetical protein
MTRKLQWTVNAILIEEPTISLDDLQRRLSEQDFKISRIAIAGLKTSFFDHLKFFRQHDLIDLGKLKQFRYARRRRRLLDEQ